jgi:hypothetical protein
MRTEYLFGRRRGTMEDNITLELGGIFLKLYRLNSLKTGFSGRVCKRDDVSSGCT